MEKGSDASKTPIGKGQDKSYIICPGCYQLNPANAESCKRCRLDFALHKQTKNLATVSESGVREPIQDEPVVVCPACNYKNSAGAETCARCRLDFVTLERPERWAPTVRPESRQVKIDYARGKVRGGLPASEYQVLSNDHAATTFKRILPRSQALSRVPILMRILTALNVIEMDHLRRAEEKFRESNMKAMGTVVVRRAEREEDDNYGNAHSKYYLTIEFDAGGQIVWLETAVDESVYNAHLLEAKITVRYCTSDPRIALIGRETTWEI